RLAPNESQPAGPRSSSLDHRDLQNSPSRGQKDPPTRQNCYTHLLPPLTSRLGYARQTAPRTCASSDFRRAQNSSTPQKSCPPHAPGPAAASTTSTSEQSCGLQLSNPALPRIGRAHV